MAFALILYNFISELWTTTNICAANLTLWHNQFQPNHKQPHLFPRRRIPVQLHSAFQSLPEHREDQNHHIRLETITNKWHICNQVYSGTTESVYTPIAALTADEEVTEELSDCGSDDWQFCIYEKIKKNIFLLLFHDLIKINKHLILYKLWTFELWLLKKNYKIESPWFFNIGWAKHSFIFS